MHHPEDLPPISAELQEEFDMLERASDEDLLEFEKMLEKLRHSLDLPPHLREKADQPGRASEGPCG